MQLDCLVVCDDDLSCSLWTTETKPPKSFSKYPYYLLSYFAIIQVFVTACIYILVNEQTEV